MTDTHLLSNEDEDLCNNDWWLQRDLARVQSKLINQFRERMDMDITDVSNPLPDTSELMTPIDVSAFRDLYFEAGGNEAVRMLFNKILNIPTRNRLGQVVSPADRPMRSLPIETERKQIKKQVFPERTRLVGLLKKALEMDVDDEKRQNIRLCDNSELEEMNKIAQIAIIRECNPNQSEDIVDDMCTIGGYNGLIPGPAVTQRMLDAVNYARMNGGTIGVSNISYDIWHNVFLKEVEQYLKVYSGLGFLVFENLRFLYLKNLLLNIELVLPF